MHDYLDPAWAVPAGIALWITLGIIWDRDRRQQR